MIESLLLTVTRITTMGGNVRLTNATGFFFERNDRLFLVTARHVLIDDPSNHHPDRLVIELHTDADNLAQTILTEVPLFEKNQPVWRSGQDSAGVVDVAVVELNRATLPYNMVLRAFSETHLVEEHEQIEIGAPVLIVGFPLGFHDTLHRLAVARQAVVASAYGIRFQGFGYFLTDAQMHRGCSGAPVVARVSAQHSGRSALAWKLLGLHATRMDVANRDITQDAFLSLNCAWYADILFSLTA